MTDAQDPVSEVVNADWHFDVLRTYALGVEILDRRLGDGEYRLLHLLRLRASGGRNNRVTHETLAKDLGVHPKTIATRMANLRQHGYITCQKSKFNAPTLKTITSMVERYDDDILKLSRKEMLGAERSDELLKRLHCIDNASEDPMGVKTLPVDHDNREDRQWERLRSPNGSENAPSVGVKTLPEVNELSKSRERDATRFARGPDQGPAAISNPDSGRDQAESRTTVVPEREEKNPETSRISADDDRPDIAALQGLAAQASSKASEKAKAAMEKSAAKKARMEASGEAETNRKLKEMTRNERLSVGFKFYEWAKEEYERFFPKIRMGKWMATEFSQLKALLDAYGNDVDLVKKGWMFVCENWDDIAKKLKIADSAPTIGLLLGMRNRIFPLVQSQKTDRQHAERQPLGDKFGEW